MNVSCDAPGCVRGLVHHDEWADPCKFCGGVGFLSFAEVCRRIDENESTVRKLLRPNRRMRPKTAARIMEKLLEVYR